MNFNAAFAFVKAKFSRFSKNQQIVISISFIILFTIGLKNLIVLIFHLYPQSIEEPLIRKHGEIFIPPHSPIRKKIKTLSIQQKVVSNEYSLPGYAETNSKKDIDIFTPLAGRIVHIPVKLGDWVVKDQILAIINAPDLAQLYSNYRAAKAELKLSQQLLERAIKVNLAGANAKKDVEIATKNKLQALANLKSIRERIQIYGKNKYSKIYLRAPSNAYVSTIYLGKGSYITDITNPLMTIINIEKIWITANVPEYLVSKLQAKQNVTFKLVSNPSKIYNGRISFINPRMDENTRTNKTRISIKNPDGLIKPDMFATINIIVPQQSKIILPTSAIFMDYESTSVFVEIRPWFFERRIVDIGYEHNGKVEVLSGLKFGDKVAVSGGIFIND